MENNKKRWHLPKWRTTKNGGIPLTVASVLMVRAELRFLGAAEHTCPGLPAVFALNSMQPTVDVGRVVSGGGLVLDSPQQTLMISRMHAWFSFASPHLDKEGRSVPGEWRVCDLKSTNGLLFNACRVMKAKVT